MIGTYRPSEDRLRVLGAGEIKMALTSCFRGVFVIKSIFCVIDHSVGSAKTVTQLAFGLY